MYAMYEASKAIGSNSINFSVSKSPLTGFTIRRYVAQRKREGVNRETQVLGQMFRLAADDEHRLIGRGLVPQIRKLEEPPPRQGIVTETQFAEILAKLPDWVAIP